MNIEYMISIGPWTTRFWRPNKS